MELFLTVFLSCFLLVVPAILILFGKEWQKYPPEKNNYFGYRTRRSLLSVDTWDYANRYAACFWYKTGKWMLLSPVPMAFCHSLSPEGKTVVYIIITAVQLFITLFPCFHIEKYLKENFDEYGIRKTDR